ncbi:histone H1 [Pedobacter miscanthi]|uniref:Histone H1 n=1 Tax=Pedobacter miscanthi TaxID=2259170 RepID=A0A366L3F0_9SPHI|nr:histone H1 [Pedobacter miscanthi]RBQ07834.1 histone H1 [Pedobacter miscanthi]
MEKFSKIKELIVLIESDAQKFYKAGNGAAGTRLRKGIQKVRNLAQEIRQEITAKKNSK